MSRLFITSSSNPRLKAIRRLRRPPRRNGAEVFLVEGYRQLARALEAHAQVRAVYAAPQVYLGDRDAGLVALAERRGAEVIELAPEAFASIAGDTRSDGILALVERWPATLEALATGTQPLLLVADRIERPGNLGTIVRAACAAGADGLIASACATDVFHPEVVRGSVGTIFRLGIARAESAEAISWLRERGIRIVVATPGTERAHWEHDYSAPCAVVVGNERGGVSEPWLRAADETVRIPMPGPADSLNVAVAAGIVLFEAVRQRVAE